METRREPDDFADALREAAGGLARTLTRDGPFGEVLAHVVRGTTAEEREALLAASRLGGPEAMCALLTGYFGAGYAWVPFRYARLRPPRQRYVMMGHDFTFVGRVWHKVSAALALECLRVNDEWAGAVFDLEVDRPDAHVAEVRERR